MKDELKKAQERFEAAEKAARALDLTKDDGELDLEKLEKCADLEGETRLEKMASYETIMKEYRDSKDEVMKMVELEKNHREHTKNLPTNDSVKADDEDGEVKAKNLKEAIGIGIKGQDLSEKIVTVKHNMGADGFKTLFAVGPDAAYDNRYELRGTKLGRYEQVLSLFNQVNIPEGEIALRGIDIAEGNADPDNRERTTATATGENNIAGTGQQYILKEIHTWQGITRLLAGDHTGYVDELGATLERKLWRKVWNDYLNADGTSNTVTGIMTQVTNTAAVAADTLIIKFLEEEIEKMRVTGGNPTHLLCTAALWATLRDAYRALNYMWTEDYVRVSDVLVLVTPDMPANTALLTDPNDIRIGIRGNTVGFTSNPYTLAKESAHYLETYIHTAVEVAYGKSTSLNPSHKKYTTTNNFKATA